MKKYNRPGLQDPHPVQQQERSAPSFYLRASGQKVFHKTIEGLSTDASKPKNHHLETGLSKLSAILTIFPLFNQAEVISTKSDQSKQSR